MTHVKDLFVALVVTFILGIVMFIFRIPNTYALLLQPFGGRIIFTVTPSVVCPGFIGPMAIMPAGIFPPYPLAIMPTIRGFPKPGDQILGLYNPFTQPTCQTTTTPPVSFPVFQIENTTYGLSSDGGF